MSVDRLTQVIAGQLVDEQTELTLAELCALTRMSADELMELVDEGILEPTTRSGSRWRFRGSCLWRVRCAVNLRADLGVNWAGAALALDLLEELQLLRSRLRRLEP